ncbi:MAG: MBL fold metallo-hydrolase [Clostridia bacterium]|nr:MBL fold metallo-hydrolase [Clostridia bacterium]
MKIQKFIVGSMGTNCYFLIGNNSDECAVVDPGAEAGRIIQKLEEKKLKCTHILLTHAHFDHIMALETVREATGAPVFVHEADSEFLTDNDLNCMSVFSSEKIKMNPAEKLLKDGDVLEIAGERVRVMHTPGHTPGSVCFLCGSDIVSGDTLFRGSIGRYDLPGGDFMTLLSSLKAISELDGDRRIYPGHGPSTTLTREREANLYLN